MSLEHYQRILSLILTQGKERQLFLSDRKAFLSEFEFPKETLVRLQKLDETEFHESALAFIDIATSLQISKDFRIQLNERKKALQNYLIEEGELPKPKKFHFKFFKKSFKN